MSCRTTIPSMARIKGLWATTPYFLAPNGLNIVEPVASGDSGVEVCRGDQSRGLVDGSGTSLSAHDPNRPMFLVEFEAEDDGDIGDDPSVKSHLRH